MKVISLDDDSELVRRLATGLIAQWAGLPEGIRVSILKDATLAIDTDSKGRTSLEQDLKRFIAKHQTAGRQ